MTTFQTDPDTQTVAAGWSSSPLGGPDHDFLLDDPAEPTQVADTDSARSVSRHALIAAALAFGIGGGAALGLMVTDFGPGEPTPVTESPRPAVLITPEVPAMTIAPTVPPVDVAAPSAMPSAPARSTVVAVPTPQAPAPQTSADDVPPPHADDAPAPEPEDPAPQPPVFDDLPFELPTPPIPEPPVFDPDLPLAPAPAPNPDPFPLPDLDLTAKP
ncbi:hypothetical protein H7J88_02460 [Mycolicibacterium flavescens]|uniref:Uncharacterized protein n=1 Tax=Mycolicibacterium flavescens TaxID=1776 RepID=A0A1E3RC30_MYCFV|nr:hypothetical protein [Mycolicibacterium flavescens]MCV7278507.1 hypothetical protein [Mycolicibacterium flavescens]ODQ87456.1 hypothetical protein BHQ18_24010 [Mycolicibacterium flavescens]